MNGTEDPRPIVEVEELRKEYSGKNGTVTAADGVSFSIKQGEIVGLLGPNGAGKTHKVNTRTHRAGRRDDPRQRDEPAGILGRTISAYQCCPRRRA